MNNSNKMKGPGSMSKLEYNSQNQLEFDGVRLAGLVKDEQDPTYVYSRKGLMERVSQFQSILAKNLQQRFFIHYAVKANAHPELLKMMKTQNLGVDVVSGGELKKSLEAGFTPQQMIFSGVGKTKEEIRFALRSQIKQINVESVSELRRIAELAVELKIKAPVVLRLNPAVDPKTHPYISTGFRENKFGIEESALGECLALLRKFPDLHLMGLSTHIGSQLTEFSALREAFQKMRIQFETLRGQGFQLSTFDVGGGLGIDYQLTSSKDIELMEQYGQVLAQELAGLEAQIQFEPGRILVGRCGVLLTQVQYIKKTPYKNFVICNSGMHHLLRPALYQAYHRIFPLEQRPEENSSEKWMADVVGPICESSDFLGRDRAFSGLIEGDWLCVAEAGAYGASMASQYNAFPLPREIFV